MTKHYSFAPERINCDQANLDPRYIIVDVLFHNINKDITIEKEGESVMDDILRPIALIDLAWRDMQSLDISKRNSAQNRSYIRACRNFRSLFRRFYKGMGTDQICVLNEYMDNIEQSTKKDYDILSVQIHNMLMNWFKDSDISKTCASFQVVFACMQIVSRYLKYHMGDTCIMEIETILDDVRHITDQYATKYETVQARINMNTCDCMQNAAKVFTKHFREVKLVL